VQDHVCHNEGRIRSLENDRTESKVYIKQINENLQEIKSDVRGLKQAPSTLSNNKDTNFKQTIIMELIKLITMLITILGAIFGITKILGE